MNTLQWQTRVNALTAEIADIEEQFSVIQMVRRDYRTYGKAAKRFGASKINGLSHRRAACMANLKYLVERQQLTK